MAFNADIGGAAANSYATVAEADAYHADRPTNAMWTAVSSKEASLIRATDYLDMFEYGGYRASEDQALTHPRAQMLTRDKHGFIGTTVIAPDVLKALYELALYLETNAASFVADDTVREVKVGPIGVKQDRKVFGEYSSLPMNVKRLLDPYLGTNQSIGGAKGFDLTRS